MGRLARLTIGAIAVMALAGCGSSTTPTGTPPTGATPTGTPGAAAGDPCATSTASGTVAAGIKDFAFDPTTVTAKVGDVITWTNNGSAGHTVTVDSAPACDTGTIAGGAKGSLTFSAAGTYAFHCKIHSSMKGTITITA